MIELILIGLGISVTTYIIGYFKGKAAEKNKQLKIGVKNAIKTKKRKAARNGESINAVRARMRKNIRK
jgi:hypothetical protein